MKASTLLTLMVILFVFMLVLSSCGTPQPPGEDLWLAVR